MNGRIDRRLQELRIELPNPISPVANYVPTVFLNNALFISGQICRWNNERRYVGKVGADISVDDARQAARLCGLNLLAQAKQALNGDLDRVVRVVRLLGFVNALPDFRDHPKVIDGASDLMVEVFGESGRHARAAVGAGSLPGLSAVEMEAVFEVRE
jgi:enamine deaminase RidA (YjgF/YER057c/UK114 family)